MEEHFLINLPGSSGMLSNLTLQSESTINNSLVLKSQSSRFNEENEITVNKYTNEYLKTIVARHTVSCLSASRKGGDCEEHSDSRPARAKS
jgi:hypothetical protein